MFNGLNNPTHHRFSISNPIYYNQTYEYDTRANKNLSVILFSRALSRSSFLYQEIQNRIMLPPYLKNTEIAAHFNSKGKFNSGSQFKS